MQKNKYILPQVEVIYTSPIRTLSSSEGSELDHGTEGGAIKEELFSDEDMSIWNEEEVEEE